MGLFVHAEGVGDEYSSEDIGINGFSLNIVVDVRGFSCTPRPGNLYDEIEYSVIFSTGRERGQVKEPGKIP